MKKIICIILLFFTAIMITACSNTEDDTLAYNTVLYDNAENWINEDFQSDNLVVGAVYDWGLAEDCPETRSFIVMNNEMLEKIFVEDIDELNIDYDTEMIIVYTFATEYVRPAKIINIVVENKTLLLDYSIGLIQNAGGAVRPFQRWFVVKMDKIDISTVEYKISFDYI